MLKKVFFIIVLVLIALILGYYSPWEKYNLTLSKVLGIKEPVKYSGMELFSLKGELELFIDDEFQGSITPDGGSLEVTDITPGLHNIRIQRKANPADSYYQFNKSINFLEGINAVAAYELGPTKEFTQGHIFYAIESSQSNDGTVNLNVNVDPDRAEIFINDQNIGSEGLKNYELDLSQNYTLKVTKEGYEELEFKILPDDQEDRDKIDGKELFIDVNLFLIPLNITQTNE